MQLANYPRHTVSRDRPGDATKIRRRLIAVESLFPENFNFTSCLRMAAGDYIDVSICTMRYLGHNLGIEKMTNITFDTDDFEISILQKPRTHKASSALAGSKKILVAVNAETHTALRIMSVREGTTLEAVTREILEGAMTALAD